MDPPTLTVAVPTYNGARHLAEALRSVLDQQGAAFDLLVSDDRSEDDTRGIVREVAGDRARVEVNAERLGLAGNWNRCVALVRTPFVAIFHQDDVMRPGHLAAHAEAIAAEPDVGLVISGAEPIDDEGRPVPESVVARESVAPADRRFEAGAFVCELAMSNPVRCSAVTLNRAVHRVVGGFDPAYRYAVDWDFWLRAARIRPVSWLARPTVAFRWHLASETHRFKGGTLDLDEQARLIEGLFKEEDARWPDARDLRRSADRRLAGAYLNRAYEAARAGDPALMRRCLREAIGRRPAILGTIAANPRLLGRLLHPRMR